MFAGFMSPEAARTGCIDALARYYKVARESVTPTSDQQAMRDGRHAERSGPTASGQLHSGRERQRL